MSDPININFWSQKNYMKRDTTTGSTILAAPITPIFLGTQYITRTSIIHGLGIVPFFNIFYEPFGDGIIWEPIGTRTQAQANNPTNPASTGPYLIAWADTTTLNIEIGYFNNLLTGTFPVYYIIYKDYGIA